MPRAQKPVLAYSKPLLKKKDGQKSQSYKEAPELKEESMDKLRFIKKDLSCNFRHYFSNGN